MKKLLTLAIVLVLVVGALMSFTACESYDYTVGVCQLVQHSALDAATQGFVDALTEKMTAAGKTVKIDIQNAGGEVANCTTIVGGFVAQNVNMIMANATPALQTASTATKSIPILGTSVTDYNEALGETIPANVSGTSDLAPLDKQAEMIKDLFPDAKKVGILFCSGEPNSIFQAQQIEVHATTLGLETQRFTFADSNDVSAVTTTACDWADVLYIPTDNTAASVAKTIDKVARAKQTPIIAGEEGTCIGCGVATLTIDYYALGRKTGEMAAQILLEGKDISTMEIAPCDEPTYKYNEEICTALGVTVPSNYQKIQTSDGE